MEGALILLQCKQVLLMVPCLDIQLVLALLGREVWTMLLPLLMLMLPLLLLPLALLSAQV